jgi:hypothetical protein
MDIYAMRLTLVDAKKKLGLPLGDLDPMAAYVKKKENPKLLFLFY